MKPSDLDRQLARAIQLPSLDARFDAAVLTRIDSLELLRQEQRRARLAIGAYGAGAVAVLAACIDIVLRLPASTFAFSLPPASTFSIPVTALAVAGAAAWLYARPSFSLR